MPYGTCRTAYNILGALHLIKSFMAQLQILGGSAAMVFLFSKKKKVEQENSKIITKFRNEK
jgi:hypothetical protein